MFVALIVAGCGNVAPTTAATSPKPSPNVTGKLACRLPVAGYLSAGSGKGPSWAGADDQAGTGGFVDFPGGKYTPTTKSDKSYLASSGVWLPVTPQAISPDQHSYVQTRAPQVSATPPTTSLYVVDVKTRSERLLYAGDTGQGAYVEAFNADGVFVESFPSGGGGTTQMSLLDPSTGNHHVIAGSQLSNGGSFSAISGNAAWGMGITFPQGQAAPYVVTLLRLGLKDGSVASWYEGPSPFSIVGFDAGNHPILAAVNLSGGSNKLTLVSAPHKTQTLDPMGGQFMSGRTGYVSDAHGAWVGSSDGSIWLYSSEGGFRKVATVPPQAGGTGQPLDQHAWRTIAGPCV